MMVVVVPIISKEIFLINGEYNNNIAHSVGGANYFYQIIDDSTIDGFYNANLAEVSGHDSGGANYFKGDISNSNITGSYINNTAWSGGANFILGNIQNSQITGLYINNTVKNAGGANHFRGKIIKSDINGEYNNNIAHSVGGANYFDQIIDDSTIDGFYNANLAEVSHDGGGANYFKGDISNSNITGSYINNTAWSGGANFILGNIQNSKITGLYTQNTAKNAGGANHFRGKIIKSDINGKYNNNRAGTGGANYFDEIIIDSIINGTYYVNVADLDCDSFAWMEGKFLMSGGANYFKCGGANYFKSDIWNTLITGDYNNNIAYSSGGANFFNGNIYSSIIDGIYKNNERTAGWGNCNYFTYLRNVIITGTYYTPSLPHGEGVDCIKSFSKDGLSKYFSYINNPQSTFSDNRTYIWSLYVNASAKVNQNSSEGNGLSPERPFKTLNEALNVVQDGATIFIAPGTYTGKGQNVDLIINKNLNLQTYGTGDVIFDAESKSRIWTVNASNLNITGITFKNGKSSYGGAIYFNNIIYNSRISGKFINNNATTGNGMEVQCISKKPYLHS